MTSELEGFQDESTHWKREGFVYCLRDRGASGAIKIGFTDDVYQKRVMGIFQAVPNDLIWIGHYQATIRQERALHKRLSESRMKGEWYHPTEEIMTFILAKFPEYTEVPSPTAVADSAVLNEILRSVGASRYMLGIFYRLLGAHGGDVLRFRLCIFQKQQPTPALATAARAALVDFKASQRERAAA